MADSQKNLLAVIVVLLACRALLQPAHCFTQEIQHYTNEISKRSFISDISGLFGKDSWVITVGEPVFILTTFVSAFNQLAEWLTRMFPGLRGLFGLLGFPLLSQPHSEMLTAMNGPYRTQRLLNHIEDQVKAAVDFGENQYENEVKKKK